MNHYTYRVAWSPYHGQYVGTCLELPFMRYEAPTAQEAIEEVSMNQWVVQKLSGRRPSDTFGLSGWD